MTDERDIWDNTTQLGGKEKHGAMRVGKKCSSLYLWKLRRREDGKAGRCEVGKMGRWESGKMGKWEGQKAEVG